MVLSLSPSSCSSAPPRLRSGGPPASRTPPSADCLLAVCKVTLDVRMDAADTPTVRCESCSAKVCSGRDSVGLTGQ